MRTKILKEITKEMKNIFYIQDRKQCILQNLPYLIFFYLGNLFSSHVRDYVGGDIFDRIFQGVSEISEMNFIPSIDKIDLFSGFLVAILVKGILYSKMKRSEEHTSELQSRQYLVCRLLLEKKK